jgi:hypothetical protein
VRSWLWVFVGSLLFLVGLLWFLQGINVLGGSAMSGKTMWAVIGPVVAVIGAALATVGARGLRRGGSGSTG